MLTIELSGRIGNHLFQYAMVRSIAEMRGFDFSVNKEAWLCHKLFNVDLGVNGWIVNNTYKEKNHFDESIFKIQDLC